MVVAVLKYYGLFDGYQALVITTASRKWNLCFKSFYKEPVSVWRNIRWLFINRNCS